MRIASIDRWRKEHGVTAFDTSSENIETRAIKLVESGKKIELLVRKESLMGIIVSKVPKKNEILILMNGRENEAEYRQLLIKLIDLFSSDKRTVAVDWDVMSPSNVEGILEEEPFFSFLVRGSYRINLETRKATVAENHTFSVFSLAV